MNASALPPALPVSSCSYHWVLLACCFPDILSSYSVNQSQKREGAGMGFLFLFCFIFLPPLIPKQAELVGKDRFAMRFVKP